LRVLGGIGVLKAKVKNHLTTQVHAETAPHQTTTFCKENHAIFQVGLKFDMSHLPVFLKLFDWLESNDMISAKLETNSKTYL